MTAAVSDRAQPLSEAMPALDDETRLEWPDDAAESAYLAEAHERGEKPATKVQAAESADEADLKSLPSLDELVQRIPPDVRETLDDLFRARFTRVKRIPREALKS